MFSNNIESFYQDIFQIILESKLEKKIPTKVADIIKENNNEQDVYDKFRAEIQKKYIECEAFKFEDFQLATLYFISTCLLKNPQTELIGQVQKLLKFEVGEKLSFQNIDAINKKQNKEKLLVLLNDIM